MVLVAFPAKVTICGKARHSAFTRSGRPLISKLAVSTTSPVMGQFENAREARIVPEGSSIDWKSNYHWRHTASVGYTALFGVYRLAHCGRPYSRHRRRGRDAEPKATRAPSAGRDDLLLGARVRFCHDERPRDLPVRRGLSSFRFGAFIVRCRDDRPNSDEKGLAGMGARTYDGYGYLLHFNADGLLCG